ncbi:5-oxoprolinase subunit PxpA [Nostocoides veronense]|uniref:5-oxoprolinase subunit A n=1 Tax=Nostocoides veronense TaxID=330836 RepID=A0ABN2LBP1_9MICO
MSTIDLNADIGEGFGRWSLTDDAGLLDVVTSANVACGFHAGDPATMQRVCRLAAERGVAIGAQVSYRDLAGFGRRFIEVESAELTADVIYQIGALEAFARAAGTRVSYVKPHGALYNAVVHHEAQAAALVAAVLSYDGQLDVLGLPGSRWLALAGEVGLRTVAEGFVDRGYTAQGTLVPRSEVGAFVEESAMPARAVRMAREYLVDAVDGSSIPAAVESLCVHGDSPGALANARAVRAALEGAGVRLAAFVAE